MENTLNLITDDCISADASITDASPLTYISVHYKDSPHMTYLATKVSGAYYTPNGIMFESEGLVETYADTTQEITQESTLDTQEESQLDASNERLKAGKEFLDFIESPEINEPKEIKFDANRFLAKIESTRHRIHYVKLSLNQDNLSFRYFYEYQDRPKYEGHWYLVDHINKSRTPVTRQFVEFNMPNVVLKEEIIGSIQRKSKYKKIITNLDTDEGMIIYE